MITLVAHKDTVYDKINMRKLKWRDKIIYGACDNLIGLQVCQEIKARDIKIFKTDNEEAFIYTRNGIEEKGGEDGVNNLVRQGKITQDDIVLVIDVDGYKQVQKWDISIENIYGLDIKNRIKEILRGLGIKHRWRKRFRATEDSTYELQKYGIRCMALICPVYPYKLTESDNELGYQHCRFGTWTYIKTYNNFKQGVEIIINFLKLEVERWTN